MPYAPWGKKLNYLWKMKATQAWDQHHREGKTNAVTGRFFGTKPMEELYDTDADPDNINNLISEPKYASDVKRLSQALDHWQVEKFDSGLMPESEVVKRSEDCGKTIYEMVRDPSLYDLRAYQAAAAMALEANPKNLPAIYENLKADDSGVRYWAVVGCFNLQENTAIDMDKMKACLNDESDHVQAMAAWILYRAGDRKSAQACWNRLLAESSYASLKVLNIIDWIGDGAEAHVEAMKKCQFSHQGYVPKMKENLGVAAVKPKKKRAK
jgi:N-sulfoglucosamine sulfohydrolase